MGGGGPSWLSLAPIGMNEAGKWARHPHKMGAAMVPPGIQLSMLVYQLRLLVFVWNCACLQFWSWDTEVDRGYSDQAALKWDGVHIPVPVRRAAHQPGWGHRGKWKSTRGGGLAEEKWG